MANEAVAAVQNTTINVKKKVDRNYWIHCTIGLLLMFGIGYLQPIDPITPLGMKIAGIFLGMIYLWTTVDTVWPSLFGIIAIASTGFITMGQAYAQSFGSSQVVLLISILALVGAINENDLCKYIGRWFVTRKIINGRPWVFTFMIFAGVYLLTILTSADTAIFLFWPILYGLFKDIGYKSGDKYATLMVIGVVLVALFGYAAMPFRGIVLLMLENFRDISGIAIDPIAYLGVSVTVGTVLIIGLVFVMKYIYRPDVTILKAVRTEHFEKEKLPPMNAAQKTLMGALVVFMAGMFLPSLLPDGLKIKAFLTMLGSSGFAMLLVAVLCVIKIDGKQLLPLGKILNKVMNWPMICIISAALVIGSALTHPDTGIRTFLSNIFSGVVEGKSPIMIMIIFVTIALIATNFSNNLVIGMIVLTIVTTLAETMGFNPVPVAMLVIFAVHIASITPAACPYAAILHSNKEWVQTKEVYKYTIGMSAYVLIVLIAVGVPLATFIIK
ncbi:MAG: SLC13 family permease [Cellulosilyticaceae bacterium]